MRYQILFLPFLFLVGCYATHSKPGGTGKTIYSSNGQSRVNIKNIMYIVSYDSLDFRVMYQMKHDPNTLNRGRLFDTMRQVIANNLKTLLQDTTNRENQLEEINTPFFDFFNIYGRLGKVPRGSHEFHRDPNFPFHSPIDSVKISPKYTDITNTLIAEFMLQKRYRAPMGGAPFFASDVHLRFAYISKESKVQVYRNFLLITSKSVDNGIFFKRGNENIDWWRPRHIEELVKRMQYELGLTDKKGRPIDGQ